MGDSRSPARPAGPCRAFLDDFSAFVDGDLPPRRRDEIQAHVDCCQNCLNHLTAYRRGVTVLRSIEAEAPVDFWTRLERRLWLGEELTLVDGARSERSRGRGRGVLGSPSPAAAVAAAAVLALFVIVRGLGPGSGSVDVGPQRIQASVAMTVPEVPEPQAPATGDAAPTVGRERNPAGVPTASRRGAGRTDDPAGPVWPALARVESRPAGSLEREIDSWLASDGWVQPVRLGGTHSRAAIRPASLVRTVSAVTPAPWNVDRAVSLP